MAVHGTEYYAEAIEAAFRKVPKRYVFGYRIELFPLNEKRLNKMLKQNGFTGVQTRQIMWKDNYKTGSDLYDFFTATSSAWWYDKFPPDKITTVANDTKKYLELKGITQLSQDVVLAFGNKKTDQ